MKFKYFIIPAVLLFVGAGCADNAKPAAVKQQPIQPAPQQQVPQPEQGIAYKNTEYGFSLTFPQMWKGYTTAKRQIDWGNSVMSPSIDFTLPGDESLFNIAVLTKAQWQKLQKDTEAPLSVNVLGENTQYVFLGSGSQDASQKNLPRRAEVTAILKTFSLQK